MGSFLVGGHPSEAACLKTVVVMIHPQRADVSWRSEGSSRDSFLAAVASAQLD